MTMKRLTTCDSLAREGERSLNVLERGGTVVLLCDSRLHAVRVTALSLEPVVLSLSFLPSFLPSRRRWNNGNLIHGIHGWWWWRWHHIVLGIRGSHCPTQRPKGRFLQGPQQGARQAFQFRILKGSTGAAIHDAKDVVNHHIVVVVVVVVMMATIFLGVIVIIITILPWGDEPLRKARFGIGVQIHHRTTLQGQGNGHGGQDAVHVGARDNELRTILLRHVGGFNVIQVTLGVFLIGRSKGSCRSYCRRGG